MLVAFLDAPNNDLEDLRVVDSKVHAVIPEDETDGYTICGESHLLGRNELRSRTIIGSAGFS